MKKNDKIKYMVAFVITAVVFFGAFLLANEFNNQRIDNIKSVEDKISMDILSSDTEFALLRDASCKQLSDSILSQELNELATKLDFMESQLGAENSQVLALKESYSLLQIKDYLLMEQLTERCDIKPVSILYFYSNEQACTDCEKQAEVLSYLRQQYPLLRVYAFDYNLNLSAIDTLIKLNHVKDQFPALVIGDNVYYGFTPIEKIQQIIPNLASLTGATSTATSTISSTTKTETN